MTLRFVVTGLLIGCSVCSAQAPQSSVQPASQPSTLRTQSHLVVLDVVVQDRSHNPVRGLKAADFQVLEGKVPQHIGSFTEHYPSGPQRPGPVAASTPASARYLHKLHRGAV